MKNVVYVCISLLTISSWSCHPTWWEVQPQAIYSPVDFVSKPYSVTVNQANSVIVEFGTKLKNHLNGKLGVYIYDDLYSLKNQLIKAESSNIPEHMKPNYPAQYVWATITDDKATLIPYDSTKLKNSPSSSYWEYTTFLLPVLRVPTADSTISRNYYSANYLKIQHSPWEKLSSLSTSGNIRFFTDSTSLFYVSNDINNLYFFKLDLTTNRFNQIGPTQNVNISKFGDTFIKYIDKIVYGFHDKEKNQYNLFISTSGRGSGDLATTGKLVLNSDFSIQNYQTIDFGGPSEFRKLHRQNDTLHLLQTYSFKGTMDRIRNPQYKDRLIRKAISLKTGKILFDYNIDESTGISFSESTNKPVTTVFLGSNTLLKYSNKPNFIYYNIKGERQEVPFPTEIDLTTVPFAVEYDNAAYMSAGQGDSKLYKVKLDTRNEISFEDTGLRATRQPSDNVSRQDSNQGLFYRGNLTLLYLPNSVFTSPEVWQLNPDRTSIDFQHPYVEVVPTNR